ncbi:MAG TPA: hypothetical protein ENI17_01825 [Pseudomonas xinjiangensis]|uniref:META domain-containing protein n=2 Tax=root TaxID=1 RepID=A0A7V1FSS8_9GAMM|nr:hypothetical protein [Halopseudomonas xinjiangensis]HEC46354.1 hypothetical protein [Halopseudomonas xinjiangensis]
MRKYITAAAALVSLMCALATQANEDGLRLEWHLPYGSIAHSTDIPGAGRGSSFSVSASAPGGFSACAENDEVRVGLSLTEAQCQREKPAK